MNKTSISIGKDYPLTATVKLFRIGARQAVLLPKNKAWDIMGKAVGKFDKVFLVDRNQPARAEQRHSL